MMPLELARRLWVAFERHGGIITPDDVSYEDIAKGAQGGWLMFDPEDRIRPTMALRDAMQVNDLSVLSAASSSASATQQQNL